MRLAKKLASLDHFVCGVYRLALLFLCDGALHMVLSPYPNERGLANAITFYMYNDVVGSK